MAEKGSSGRRGLKTSDGRWDDLGLAMANDEEDDTVLGSLEDDAEVAGVGAIAEMDDEEDEDEEV